MIEFPAASGGWGKAARRSIRPSLRISSAAGAWRAWVADITPRERAVLEPMAESLSNLAIAERRVVTQRAVEKH